MATRTIVALSAWCAVGFAATAAFGQPPDTIFGGTVRRSDVVIVGTTGSPEYVRDETYVGRGNVGIAAQRFSIPVTVERVFKGENVPPQLDVIYFGFAPRAGGYSGPGFVMVPANSTCILCLMPDDDGDYRLPDPMSLGNLIVVGRAMPPPAAPPASAEEAVVLQLLFSAAAEDLPTEVRRRCIAGVISIDFYPCQPKRGPRPDVSEAEQQRMRDLYRERVLPALLELTKSDDAALSQQAWETLVYEQYPGAAPVIADMARKEEPGPTHSSLAWRLSNYRCPSAELTAVLNPLLDDPDTRVREAVAYSLREVADKSSIPYLIRRLDDTNDKVRYYVVCALSDVTGENVYPSIPYFEEKEAEFISFWKDWAANHPEAVKEQ
jgi:hypothetical protein